MRYMISDMEMAKFMRLIDAAESVCFKHGRGELGTAANDSVAINQLCDAAKDAKWFHDSVTRYNEVRPVAQAVNDID